MRPPLRSLLLSAAVAGAAAAIPTRAQVVAPADSIGSARKPAWGEHVIDHDKVLNAPNASLAAYYRSRNYIGAAEHQLDQGGGIGFRLAVGYGLLQAGFGTDLGFAYPRGPLMRDSVLLDNPNVQVGGVYGTVALLLPLRVTCFMPYVDLGRDDLTIYDRKREKEIELGGGGYWEYGLRTILPFTIDPEGVYGLGLAVGRRQYFNGANPHYPHVAHMFEVSYAMTGWLLRK